MPLKLLFLAILSSVIATPAAAAAPKCQLSQYLELPVELTGRRAIVTTQIGGKDARFILDSGAFYSTLSRASAAEYGLSVTPAPPNFLLHGINGATTAGIAMVDRFVLGGIPVSRVQFLVGGSDMGSVGLLGENFLSLFDVEYDFPHGMVRLLRVKDCPDVSAAYWAANKPITIVPLEPRVPPFQTHVVGGVTLNGVKLKAVFDTGAPGSTLTQTAAKRAGMLPDSPGVVAAGYSTGLGSRSIAAWMGTFRSLDIGGEAIPNPRLRFANIEIGQGDMLIGFDFFLTHRILVERSGRMLVTYEGGPVFGLDAPRAIDASGAAIDLSNARDAAPKTAEEFGRRGGVLASSGKLEAAIADFDQAVTLAPGDARYLRMRAQARLANRQPLLAAADLDKAIAIDPAEPEGRMTRAMLRLGAHDPTGALEDLRVADNGLPPSSDKRLRLASLFTNADDSEAALPNFDSWLKYHSADADRPVAFNGRCWARALLNRELDKALGDCNAAIRARPNASSYLDSRALVQMRRGDLTSAKADYDAALAISPHNGWMLYQRSLVRRKLGDVAGAESDRAAALAAQPGAPERAKRLGLE